MGTINGAPYHERCMMDSQQAAQKRSWQSRQPVRECLYDVAAPHLVTDPTRIDTEQLGNLQGVLALWAECVNGIEASFGPNIAQQVMLQSPLAEHTQVSQVIPEDGFQFPTRKEVEQLISLRNVDLSVDTLSYRDFTDPKEESVQ